MAVAKNTFYNLAGSIIPIAMALITVPLYLKLIGQERYGVLTIAWLILGYFGLFDLGLGRATTYRVAAIAGAPKAVLSRVLWSAVLANLIMGVVGGFVLWAAGALLVQQFSTVNGSLKAELIESLPLLGLSVPVATLTGVLTGALLGQERFLEANLISTWTTALFQILPLVAAVLISHSLTVLLCAAVAARMIGIAFLLWRCRTTLSGPPILDGSELKALLRYGGWVSLESAVNPLLTMADRVLIGGVIGAAAVAAYAIPFQVVSRLSILPTALSNALFPKLTSSNEIERFQLSTFALKTLIATLSAIAAVGLIGLHPFLKVWIGPKVAQEAYLPGLILILSFWLNSLGYVAYSQLASMGRPDLLAKLHVVELIPYLGVLYIGVAKFGLVGAAAAYLIRSIVDYALINRVAFKGILLPGTTLTFAAILGAVFAVNQVSSVAPWEYGISGLLLIVVGVLSWAIAPQGIKAQIMSVLGRLGRRTTQAS